MSALSTVELRLSGNDSRRHYWPKLRFFEIDIAK